MRHTFEKKNDKSITSMFRRKIHLINNFKTNMFINNDIIDSKSIIINSIKKQTFINSIDVIISIEIKSSKNNIQRSIHIRKTIVISSHIEIIVFINDINLLKNKDFLFESIDDVNNFIFYVHLIDAFTFVVVVRNDCNQFIQIFRNFKLNRISKLNYSNVFQVSFEQTEHVKFFTIKKSKFTHRNDWFKKILIVCVTTYAIATTISIDKILVVNNSIDLTTATLSTFSVVNMIISIIFIDSSSSIDLIDVLVLNSTSKFSKLMLFNDVTIHRSNATNFFVKIVEKFSII